MSDNNSTVVFQLAVWGEKHIRSFFAYSLRSLLAPGNIPAMSQEYSCSFLFLTQKKDIPIIKARRELAKLAAYCTIEFIEITDLIFEGNFSATLTLAYERAIRSRGEKMCHTYFFSLVSDYIMANGSLNNLKRYMKAGYSAITTGNFLVVEEYVENKIKKIRDGNQGIIALNPREMVALALPFIHPVSTSQMVTQSFTHAKHANRLFWKVNDQLIVGRFYLRHMLCIKPEIENYTIGASCDYSFISEMCPSGKVAHVQDSDEYFLIEMAPFSYEKQFIAPGPFKIAKLAEHLSEWTTSEHRANAYIPVAYHSEELTGEHLQTIQTSLDYVKTLEEHMTKMPQPIRGHHYWLSCVESLLHFYFRKADRLTQMSLHSNILKNNAFSPIFGDPLDDQFILKASHPSFTLKRPKKKEKLKSKLEGKSPGTALWQLHGYDDYHIRKSLQNTLSKASVVIAFEPSHDLICWLEKNSGNCAFQYYDFFTKRSSSDLQAIFANKNQAIIWLTDGHFFESADTIRHCSRFLPQDSTIFVYYKPNKPISRKTLNQSLAICNADLSHAKISQTSSQFFQSLTRGLLQNTQQKFSEKSFAPGKKWYTRLMGMTSLCSLNGLCLIGNLLSPISQSRKKTTSAIFEYKT